MVTFNIQIQNVKVVCLREMRRFEGRYQRTDVNRDDGNNDTGQEDGGQLVHILHTNKNQQGHQEETDGAVDAHVVQHSCTFALRMLWFKNGSFGYNIHLKRQTQAKSNKDRMILIQIHVDAWALCLIITTTCSPSKDAQWNHPCLFFLQ